MNVSLPFMASVSEVWDEEAGRTGDLAADCCTTIGGSGKQSRYLKGGRRLVLGLSRFRSNNVRSILSTPWSGLETGGGFRIIRPLKHQITLELTYIDRTNDFPLRRHCRHAGIDFGTGFLSGCPDFLSPGERTGESFPQLVTCVLMIGKGEGVRE
jgi:hypothetical protein